jgi:Protein of unknown function (DUF2721)
MYGAMSIELMIRSISLILAPVLMVSSCALFLNGLLQRYYAISSTMRAMHRERFDLLRAAGTSLTGALESIDGVTAERLHEIETQLPNMLQRHNLIQHAVLVVDVAILVFVVSMFIIAFADMTNSPWTALVALFCFLTGMGVLLLGVAITTIEVYRSQRELTYEIRHGLGLGKK